MIPNIDTLELIRHTTELMVLCRSTIYVFQRKERKKTCKFQPQRCTLSTTGSILHYNICVTKIIQADRKPLRLDTLFVKRA